MISEEQKYRAYTYNIAGFALLTPFGKLILDITMTFSMPQELGLLIFVCYIILCIFLSVVGFRLIEIGRGILDTINND